MQAPRFKNIVLQALDAETIARLHLHPVQFELRHEIEFPGSSIDHLFFVEEGMASITNTFADGSQVEVGMFGYESMIGISALMGTKRSLNRVYTQIEGFGYSSRAELARREFARGGPFQSIALRCVQAQLVQAMQSAGCNAKHEIQQRLARWLLLCADRVQSQSFRMPQEFIADMLGNTRPAVSIAAGLLKDEGLIEYSRGLIHILDVGGLEQRSCECYRIVKDHLDSLREFDSGIASRDDAVM